MSKDKYPFDMEVLTKHNQVVKGDWTYTLLGNEQPSHVLINNHRTQKKSVCIPLSAILELIGKEK